ANVILGTAAATGLTFSGNRTGNTAAIRCEGQGGWTIANYFSADAVGGTGGFFSPFMQPVTAGYLFYGPTSAWIDANAATPSYNAGSFVGTKDLFSASTGRKLAPAVNDVMGEAGGFIRWDGSAWVTIASATFGGLAFHYGKYRQAWAIAAPTIMHVLLGTNDFASVTTANFAATYATYKTRYDSLIASVKADTPGVKFMVGIPVSPGRQGRNGTLDTERRKRGHYLLAKQLNADFGGREGEGIYLLDYHSVVDRFYGYDNTYEKPFTDYSGATGDDLYKSDTVHLGLDGFKQMGNAYMGLIQFLR
ncbi:MAG: SGNH/GDSL hydrolase family protein, partial [Polaromonas sp.]|nr:SGNH/GDSL hydrolase family protein [Polaromonas sp.]